MDQRLLRVASLRQDSVVYFCRYTRGYLSVPVLIRFTFRLSSGLQTICCRVAPCWVVVTHQMESCRQTAQHWWNHKGLLPPCLLLVSSSSTNLSQYLPPADSDLYSIRKTSYSHCKPGNLFPSSVYWSCRPRRYDTCHRMPSYLPCISAFCRDTFSRSLCNSDNCFLITLSQGQTESVSVLNAPIAAS